MEQKTHEFIRNCPRCKKELKHSNKNNRNIAHKNKRLCYSCAAKKLPLDQYVKYRNCPDCGVEIKYKRVSDKLVADKRKSKCKSCSDNKGKFIKGQETLNKLPLYDCWKNRFGKEVADQKLKEFKQKQSELGSGSKNSMYNKTAPVGSGNGWSGWYKGWLFRSLTELSYMVSVIERFKLNWKDGEDWESVKYIGIKGQERTYRADFIIENKYVIECKPKKLQGTKGNKLKESAMRKFCDSVGMIFKYVDCPKLPEDVIKRLHDKGDLVFIERWEKKYLEKYVKD